MQQIPVLVEKQQKRERRHEDFLSQQKTLKFGSGNLDLIIEEILVKEITHWLLLENGNEGLTDVTGLRINLNEDRLILRFCLSKNLIDIIGIKDDPLISDRNHRSGISQSTCIRGSGLLSLGFLFTST